MSWMEKGLDNLLGGSGQRNAKKKAQQISQMEGQDKQAFKIFQSQDLLNVDQNLFVPAYHRNKKLEKEQEALLTIFNARKDQILESRATPGINQTRF